MTAVSSLEFLASTSASGNLSLPPPAGHRFLAILAAHDADCAAAAGGARALLRAAHQHAAAREGRGPAPLPPRPGR